MKWVLIVYMSNWSGDFIPNKVDTFATEKLCREAQEQFKETYKYVMCKQEK